MEAGGRDIDAKSGFDRNALGGIADGRNKSRKPAFNRRTERTDYWGISKARKKDSDYSDI